MKGGVSLFRNRMSVIMYIVISLAIIGLTAQLLRDFTGFLLSILIMIVIAFVVFLILSHIARNRMAGGGIGQSSSSPEAKKYREAVKRSQEKYGRANTKVKQTKTQQRKKRDRPRRRWRRRRPSHLRLIKGKKSNDDKKNDRASF